MRGTLVTPIGRGPMAVAAGLNRALPDPDLLEHVRTHYRVGGVELTMDLGGSRSENLLVTTGSGMLVVRAYPATYTLDRLLAIQSVRRALNAHGVASPLALRALNGESWTRHDGRLVEVEEYVHHSARLDSWERLETALPVLARAHTVLRQLGVSPASRKSPLGNYPTTAEVLEWTSRARSRFEGGSSSATSTSFLRSSEGLAQRIRALEGSLGGALPAQVIHGNFWGNSVLFRSGRVVLVTGLDFLAERARVEDLALTLYLAFGDLSRDLPSDRNLRRLRRLVDLYDQSLEPKLTPLERRALPLALARLPFGIMSCIAQARSPEEAGRLTTSAGPGLAWSASIVDRLEPWQLALT
jgi:homoserine kinase type II